MGSTQSNSAKLNGYEDTYIDFEDVSFAKGTSRRVYRGRFRGDQRVDGKQGVVKVYKEWYSSNLEELTWKADDRAYKIASEIAQEFNNLYQTSKPIKFITPEFIDVDPRTAQNFLGFTQSERGSNTDVKPKVSDVEPRTPDVKQSASGSNTDIPKIATIAVERYLDGTYVKFSSNTGYVHPKPMATPAAFSHFSYHVTDGEILVCDLQGVRTNTSYELTDPAVHSGGTKANEYGPNDWGKCGIVKFFMTHKCNELCKELKKPTKALDCTESQWEEFTKVVDKMPGGSSTASTYRLEESYDISPSKLREIQERLKLKADVEK